MRYGVYAIRDDLTGFLTPTLDQTDEAAARNFRHACINENNLFYSHASDYSLFKIGEYETDTGELFPCIPKSIISGIAAKKGITEGVENV